MLDAQRHFKHANSLTGEHGRVDMGSDKPEHNRLATRNTVGRTAPADPAETTEVGPSGTLEELNKLRIEHAIGYWKRRSQGADMADPNNDPDPLWPGLEKNRLFLKIAVEDVELFRNKVWREFFDKASLPSSFQQEWASDLSCERMPDSGVDLSLTFALTRQYVKAVGRAAAELANLLATAAVSRLSKAQITSRYRECVWRECLEFAGQLGRWERYGVWVDRVVLIRWKPPLTPSGVEDRELVVRAGNERREFFESRVNMYWSEWIDAIDRELDVRLTVSAPQVKVGHREGTGLQYDRWREFHEEFSSLAKEELAISRLELKDNQLRALCDYSDHPEVFERGKPNQGRFCLLLKPEHGLWIIYGGANESFEAKFRTLATRAGLSLVGRKGGLPEDFWLHSLYLNLRENRSKELLVATDEGGMILHVNAASATFCLRLEKEALEASEASPEGDTSSLITRDSFVSPILADRGWSVLDWAQDAGVDYHTASDYLKNETKPHKSTRTKLAKSLGVDVKNLPG